MLITFLSWILITFFAVNIGILINCMFNKFFSINLTKSYDIIITGIMGLTVYAGLFSLVYKVGLVANIILLVLGILITISPFGRNKWSELLQPILRANKNTQFIVQTIIFLILLFATLIIGSSVETFYDTELYHAQAIRWIEEYGIVKGLGLLHSRFSYNSCFMPLQALFGYKYLFGIELHNVNAYMALVLSCWAIFSQSLWQRSSFKPQDGLKCVQLLFTWVFQLDSLSSPNSDFLALSMATYICATLCESIYTNITAKDDAVLNNKALFDDFLFVSFLAVFAVSLKLSVAMIVLVALFPGFVLLKNKRFKEFFLAIAFGIVIISPYLLRNIIISGYLVYPYTQIDLFDVTWKVSKSLADYDRKEIMVWGKSLNDADLYDYTLKQWLPIWWSHVEHLYRRILEIAFILIACAFIRCGLYLFLKKKSSRTNMLLYVYIVCAAMLCMWFFSAPLLRYGMVFALLIPGMFIGDMLSNISFKYSYIAMTICLFVAIGIGRSFLRPLLSNFTINPISPVPYIQCDNIGVDIGELTIYVASPGTDWVGYNDFPAIPYYPDTNYLGIVDTSDLSKGFWNAEIY